MVSAAKAREWRRLSNIDQVNKIKELKEQEEKIEREQQRAANRERRASRRRGDDLLRTPPKQVTTKKKPRRGQNTPVSASGIQEEGDDESGDLIQSRLGSDPCESTFMLKRNANPNADKIGTDHILASIHGGPLVQLWASRKGNVEKKRVFFGKELMLGKFERTR